MDTPNIPMRLNVTGTVREGNTLAAVLLIGHPMESGYRTLDSGQRIPKNVITSIRVQLGGQSLFDAETGIGVSAHPYLAFPVPLPAPLPASGVVLSVNWVDDKGQRGEIKRELKPS
jgi:sulfur-oxidizing protein SoxZ